MKSTLKIQQLSKSFGKIKAVQKLDLEVQPGQIYGILGPNGSGKTTTLGMILDVVAPDSGSFKWFGGMPNIEARKQIGSILETPCFLPYLSAVKNLEIVAHIKEAGKDRIDDVLKQVGLYERKNDKFKTFSLGMKQRLSIGAALLSDPPVLILDEPTNGLDPQGIAEVRQLIVDIANQGKTILIASHLLDEVQKVCTRFCVLQQGVKLHEGAEFHRRLNNVKVQRGDDPHRRAPVPRVFDLQLRGVEGDEIPHLDLSASLPQGCGTQHVASSGSERRLFRNASVCEKGEGQEP